MSDPSGKFRLWGTLPGLSSLHRALTGKMIKEALARRQSWIDGLNVLLQAK